ncbi:hypothetical protein OE88DRAFT_1810318 [Heliocybe sulcata]|uniref:Uncharacterized protein n=1 Tax=Heliocybe sulcata TaxID=5364 RepID=A0A5C3MUA6_9AGAM|nr:hypothetical protein OE88DRAFT_1810318 [Heliocybe sulcata]
MPQARAVMTLPRHSHISLNSNAQSYFFIPCPVEASAPSKGRADAAAAPALPTSRVSPVWDQRFNTHPRNTTFSNISAWALNVQPGSPEPLSPERRASVSSPRRPSISAISPRRLSVPSVRVSSASFLNLQDTPLPGQRTAYTPIVVEFPTSPKTAGLPTQFTKKDPVALYGIPLPPVPKKSGRVLSRMRSLSVFGNRGRPKSSDGPAAPKAAPTDANAKLAAAAEIASRKKEGYKMKTKQTYDRPVPLAAQLELAQMMDGGSMDHRIKAHMHERARAERGLKRGQQVVGVGDVWRDGEGGIWLDQEEEWEYAHLLSGEVRTGASVEHEWVDFEPGSPVAGGEGRRGSVSTQSSDLDPNRLVQASEGLDDSLGTFGGNVLPTAAHKPGMPVLSLSPAGGRSRSHEVSQQSSRPGSSGSARRRPAPLILPPSSPSSKRPTNSPINPEAIRRDFLENSFQPEVAESMASGPCRADRDALKKLRRGSIALLSGYTNAAAASTESFASSGTKKAALKKPSLMHVFKGKKEVAA